VELHGKKMFSDVPSWVGERTVISYPTSCQLHSTLNHMDYLQTPLLTGFLGSLDDDPFWGYKMFIEIEWSEFGYSRSGVGKLK